MTGQMHNHLHFRGQDFLITSVYPKDLFSPETLGITTYSRNTACWCGYLLYFGIKDEELVLQNIILNTKDSPPKINGVSPTKEFPMFDYTYPSVNYKIEFSGEIEIGTDFINELYVHGGFQPSSSYKTVFKLEIKNDLVVNVEDLSSLMEKKRNNPEHEPINPIDYLKGEK